MSRWFFVLVASLPVACAQVAGLDQEYTVSESADAPDAGADGAVDASFDAALDARERRASECSELDETENPCASCVSSESKCEGICRDQVLGKALRAAYFQCLEGAKPESCVPPGLGDERQRQIDCIQHCQRDGDCRQ